MKDGQIKQLYVFRALAALSVCSIHFTYESFFNNYFAQHVFVQLFFSLSGFIIAYNYHNKLNNLKTFFKFIIKRFRRLYPLHFFFLISFLILEIIKYILVHKFDIQSNSLPFEINSAKNFLLNLFFVQHFADQPNFNGPSWSISVEMMLYATFGITLLIFKNKFLIICLYFIYIIFFIFFLNSHYGEVLSIFAFYSGLYSFLIGCLFFFYLKKIKNISTPPLNGHLKIYFNILFYVFLSTFLLEIFYLRAIEQRYFYSIIFGLIFFYSCLLNKKFFLFKILFNNIFIFIGKISYSIYMSHLVIFYIFNNLLVHVFRYETKFNKGRTDTILTSFEANFYTIIIYILVILFSSITYKYVEMKYYKK